MTQKFLTFTEHMSTILVMSMYFTSDAGVSNLHGRHEYSISVVYVVH